MSESKNPGDKTISVGQSKTLTLKRPVEHGTVRQSFSHGRSKSVVVEKVKRRALGPGELKEAPPAPIVRQPPPQTVPSRPPPPPQRPTGVVLRTLTEDEREARIRALTQAKGREEEDRRAALEEARRRAEREAIEQAEREAAEARKREEEDRRRREDEGKRRAEDEASRRLGDTRPAVAGREPTPPLPRGEAGPGTPTAIVARPRPSGSRPPVLLSPTPPASATPKPTTTAQPSTPAAARPAQTSEDETPRPRRPLGAGAPARPALAPKPTKTAGDARQRGRLTVSTALTAGDERTHSVAAFRRRVQRMNRGNANEPRERLSREVVVPETITIQELANRMSERAVDVIRMLMKQGQMHKITDVIDADTAQLIAEELGHTVRRVAESDVEEGLFSSDDPDDTLVPRPPVVTIMGHVDHGKTSLLDAVRKTNVVSGEAGGITQHIGAYQVTSPLGGKITFIDTPGHAAFTSMRARGAKVTDIVVLVVAADDGVKPQTIEAINHAKAARVPIIVAINKVDKPDANPQRVRTELLQHEVVVESMGGDTLEFEVSAKVGTNLDKLLEGLQLQSEILDLRANPDRSAEGNVIEAKLDRGRGPVATVLVDRGTLHVGDIVVAGSEWGRVRALIADTGEHIKEAGPSMPAEVLGFNGTPEAGDRVAVVENEARAREITEFRARQRRDLAAARGAASGRSLADMMRDLKEGAGKKEFNLVVKGDVQGSVEAIRGALEKLGNDEVTARILHAAVGGITESDITLAEASKAVVVGFNVRANKEAREAADRASVEIRYYSVIYDLVDDVKQAMSGLLAPTLREHRLGEAQILEIFDVSKVGKVAGCRVVDGVVERGAFVRLIRDSVVIHEGKLSQLKRYKDDAKEVGAGQECGMSFESYQDMRKGDVIECYRVEEIRRSL
ncbi:translation initiation factor IF-2 [Chelatococcus reniformis]|uniref:Translation initiation factor IF-2 n=1 Tax=Chelatococcus reniformis TaxID=1494448 RepID=A0A916TZ80_9HYPH|nr:translation initiation factor IF-2 [Chelatococcus reniformis]GGC52197.1 translation initiation factor IF-2 [Chelatococcus reniformis]